MIELTVIRETNDIFHYLSLFILTKLKAPIESTGILLK